MAEHFAAREDVEVTGTYHRSEPPGHPDIHWVRADLTQRGDVERVVRGMDIVIQAAATTSGARDIVHSPATHVTDNAVMNALLFRACFEQRVGQVLFFSCTTMYPSGDRPLREADFDANAEIYAPYFGGAWTKVYNEKMCAFYAAQGGGRWTVLRHSNIYGPYDKYDLERSHVFGATVTKVMTASEGQAIVVWGDGSQARELLHVDDLKACVAAVLDRQTDPFALFNVGCGHAICIRDLVQRIVALSGRALEITFDTSKPVVNTRLCLDCTQARQLLDWEPRVSLDEGIRRTLAWYRENRPVTPAT
jgi:nucleoside-diphosphate-sugar epimerase